MECTRFNDLQVLKKEFIILLHFVDFIHYYFCLMSMFCSLSPSDLSIDQSFPVLCRLGDIFKAPLVEDEVCVYYLYWYFYQWSLFNIFFILCFILYWDIWYIFSWFLSLKKIPMNNAFPIYYVDVYLFCLCAFKSLVQPFVLIEKISACTF